MESFSYLPLPTATQIRLVAFESNPTGGNANSLSLSCRLLVYDIEDAPPFVALSYTWGPACQGDTDEQMTHGNKILMNGLIFEVTLNLRNALDSIQMRCQSAADSEPKLFWVDAICINQHDMKERTAQVAIMGRIYSKAARVWMWLGLAREINMEKVIVLIGKLSKASHDIQTKRGANQSSSNTNWDIATDQGRILKKYKPPPWRNPVWVDLALLFERNWWTRIWIVQEIALAAKAEMMCGNYSIPWNQVRLCSHLLVAGLDAQLGHQLQIRRETEKTITHVGAGLMTLDGICQMIDSPNKDNRLANVNAYFTGKPKLGSAAGALCVLLHLCRGRSASVPKDQVYALLGLLPVILQFSTVRKEHPEIILADYEKSDSDVFIQTARWIIEQTQWLGYLTLIEDHGFERDLSLPTWVGDMTKLPPTRLDICNELARSESIWSGHVLKKAESMIPKIVDNILHSAGTRLGTIAKISKPLDDICNGKSTFEEGASIMLDIPRKYTYTKEPREDVLWKLLSGEKSTETSLKIPFGQFWLRKLIENISGSNLTLEKFLETIPSIDILGRSVPDVSLPSHSQIRDAFASSYVKSEFRKLRENLAYESGGFEGIFRKLAVSRRFFRTERNHLGLCHSSARPGDEVWCLVRAPTPFIFRKTGDAKNFKLVGPAYIYGFVDSILPTLEVENSDIRIE